MGFYSISVFSTVPSYLGKSIMYDDFIFTIFSEKRKTAAEQGNLKPQSSDVVFFSIILSFLFKVPDFCIFETQIHT